LEMQFKLMVESSFDRLYTFNTPLEMLNASLGDGRWVIYLSFQYSIGDAVGEEPEAVFYYLISKLSILHWRCRSLASAAFLAGFAISFNTPLEMPRPALLAEPLLDRTRLSILHWRCSWW